MSQPLVSVVFLSYNQEKYVGKALESILNQTYRNLEVIISDDHSLDSSREEIHKVLRAYDGSKRIKVVDNKRNLGLSKNFNQCLSMCNGTYIAPAAGDDISYSDRISNAIYYLELEKSLSVVSFDDIVIDEDGKKISTDDKQRKLERYSLENLIKAQRVNISGASRVFRRTAYDTFGDLEESCPSEDSTYILRFLILGDALKIPSPGIQYRRHLASLSSLKNRYKMDFQSLYNQYFQDLSRAKVKGILTQKEFLKMEIWLSNHINYRDFLKEAVVSEKSIISLLELLLKKKMLLRDKLRAFRFFIRTCFRWG